MNTAEVHKIGLNPRQIPTLSYTMQNIAISIATMIASTMSLLFTVSVILPLSILRSFLPRERIMLASEKNHTTGVDGHAPRKKVVLIVGASRGIGFNVLKQYASEPDTVIIAASRSIESLRKAVIEIGDTVATIQCAEIDLTASKKQLVDSIKVLDRQYGPITHLYEVSGISNHLKASSQWGLDVTLDMINVNVTGTITSVLTMYELMKARKYGKICVVGSVAGLYSPANMISYAATKSFINTFSSSLRVLAAPHGVEVVTVQPGFIDTRMTKMMRGQGSTVPSNEFASAEGMARQMKMAVEEGGAGVVCWPGRQGVQMHALKAVNPICEEVGKFVSMKMGLSGRKIT
ncbi:NAD(P)-binding protein [Agrocybe pediades]|nr:NAD(P)-binding protein [Agrocybe pediades]